MAKFSKERLEGKALEDAFKLLAQRRKASLKKDLKEGITIPLSKLEPKIGAVKIKGLRLVPGRRERTAGL